MSALADSLRLLLAERFPDRGIELRTGTKYGPGTHVAHIPCPSGAAGDIDIELDEDLYPEVTIYFDEPTGGHAHFVQYDSSYPDVLQQCCDFLEDLFAGRYLLWGYGGCAYAEDDAALKRWMTLNPGVYLATWNRVLRGDRSGDSEPEGT